MLMGREYKPDISLPQSSQTLTQPQQAAHTSLQKPQQAFKVVRFIQTIPAIMGVDMMTYGPFKAEDVASLPAPNAENLIRKGIAKEVEISP